MAKWLVIGSKYFGEVVYTGEARTDTELPEKVDTAISWNPDRIICERMLELNESETSNNEKSENNTNKASS